MFKIEKFQPLVHEAAVRGMKLRAADLREFTTTVGDASKVHDRIVQALELSGDWGRVVAEGTQIIAALGVLEGGWIWACGSDEATKYRKLYWDFAKDYIEHAQEAFRILRGIVDSRNITHIRWLRKLGFKLTENVVHFNGVPFHLFERS